MVNGIGGPSIPQLLQTLTTQQTQTTTQTQPTPGLTPFEEAAQAAGIDVSKLQGLREKIQVAVEDAVKSAPDKSGQQLMDLVRDTVDKVLQDNGIDPTKIRNQLATVQNQMGGSMRTAGANGGRHHHGAHPAQAASSTATTSSSTTDSTLNEIKAELEGLMQSLQGGQSGSNGSTGASATSSTTTSSSWDNIKAELDALVQSLGGGQGGTTGSANVGLDTLLADLQSGDAQAKERANSQLDQLLNVLQQAKQQENNDNKAARLANTVTTALLGPAVDQYA